MKSSILVLSLLGFATWAQGDQGSGYPYMAENNCKTTILLPQNSGGIAFNKDCSVGFVMPERVSKMTVTPRKSMALTLCSSYQDMLSEVQGYTAIVKKYQEKLQTAPVEEAEKLYSLIEKTKELQKKSQAQLDQIEGMRVNVLFESGLENQISKFKAMNPETVTFAPAPIAEGRIQYKVESPELYPGVAMNPILSTNIPGNHKVINQNQGEVDFSGALTGELALTLTGACPFVDVKTQNGKTVIAIDEDRMNHTITANYTYAMPTVSSAGYDASLDTKKALDLYKVQFATKTEFHRHDFVDSIITNEVSNIFQWKIYNYEGQFTDEVSNALKQDVAARLTDKFMKALSDFNMVQASPPQLVPPEPGVRNEHHTRRQCSSSSSFFGLFSSSSCYDVTYTIPIKVAGTADAVTDEDQVLNMIFSEKVDVSGIIYRKGTSTFQLKAKTQDFDGSL